MLDFAIRTGYLGAFLISVFANATIFFPIPYAISVYTLGTILDPPFLGIICGLGAALGELTAYALGFVGRKLIDAKYGHKLKYAMKLLGRYGVFAIFIFSATPMPVDLIMIPIGMLRYNLFRAMVACLLGKTVMCVSLAYAGRFSFGLIRTLFEAGGIWGAVAAIILLILIIILLLRIDWWSVFETVEKRGWRGLIKA